MGGAHRGSFFYDVDGCSLKYYMYFLAGDDSLSQYPHFQVLVERRHEPGFEQKLRKSLVIFFRGIAEDVSDVCALYALVVDRIALPVPPQFSKAFQDLYTGVVLEAVGGRSQFSVQPEQIEYVTEGEALAHFSHHGKSD